MEKYQKLYYYCLIIYALFLGYSFYDNLTNHYMHSLVMSCISLGLMFFIPLLFKILRWKSVYEIYILGLIFMFLSSLLGSAFRFYDNIPYWDKYVHCFSGVLGLAAAYILFFLITKKHHVEKNEYALLMVFINAMNITIATLWELFEYSGLVLFNYDGIRHYTSGVHDSMSDIIVCIIGGIIASLMIYRGLKSKKGSLITGIYEKFYILNIKK